jgi:hypothetical protein
MKPQTIGRALGIGLRVAGRIAGQQLAGTQQSTAAPRPAGAASIAHQGAAVRPVAAAGASTAQSAGRMTGHASRGIVKGVGGFLRPFGRIGGTLWLEVTGVFFLLPVIVFLPTVWSTRMNWWQGPDHRKFVSSVIVVAVFLYLGITSFLRARRRSAQ